MYQIGLKLWSTNTDVYLHEAERLYVDGIFSYVELYVVPGTLECLPTWKKLQIPFLIHNAHFMQHFNLADRECAKSNRKIYEETRRFADALNARWIIFHGGTNGTIEETARQLKSFSEPRALIENKPYCAMVDNGTLCRGATPEEIQFVMRETGCGFCCDISHAFCAANYLQKDSFVFFSELLKLQPVMFHISDNDSHSRFDRHYHLGQGSLDLKRILSLCPEDARITIETQKDSADSLQDFLTDCEYLNESF